MIKISRFPKEAYNRDIILYLVMFGYKYKIQKIVKSMKQLIIFGSGDYAKMIFHELKKDKKYKILGFFDERKKTRFFKSNSKLRFIDLDQKIKKLKKFMELLQ